MPPDTLISRADLILEFGELQRLPQPPTLAQFLTKYPDLPIADLVELVMMDQSARWSRGERIMLEAYLAQFPTLLGDDEELVSLLGYEYELRQVHGEVVDVSEYTGRFPALEGALLEHFRVCRTLAITTWGERDAVVPEAPAVPSKFYLIAVHAEGGLGRVWRAHDRQLQREVVVKELRPELAGRPNVRARFLREARVTGQLEHPNIVPVYELIEGSHHAPPCYAMRFVRGQTLSEAVHAQFDQRRLGVSDPMAQLRLLNAFLSVCNAVAYAHSRGIVHRDLKPENIVLGRFGEVFVADWGLAKITGATDVDSSTIALGQPAAIYHTAPGSIMGTPAYMAPEQALGDSQAIDARTDIYGLGSILYVILTGRPPHEGSSRTELLRRVSQVDPERPRRLNRAVPPALEAICLKAMARAPDQRYRSATELAQEVQRWMVDQPVEAYREPVAHRVRRWLARQRPIVMVASLLVLAVVAGSLIARANRASLAKLHPIQARQESAERFSRLQKLSSDAYYYGLPGPMADLARAARSCAEALGLYGCRTAEQCSGVADGYLSPAAARQLPGELARLLMLDTYFRARSLDRAERRAALDATKGLLQQVGLAAGTLPDYFTAEEYRVGDELEEAIRWYGRVLDVEPGHYWAWTGLGHCYLRTGQSDLARMAYQTCVALHPESPWPWVQRGVAAALAHDLPAAEADFQQALSIDGDFQPARYNLGLLLAARGSDRLAIEQFDAFLTQAADPDVLNARARSWLALGDFAKAKDDIESAFRQRAGFAPALVTRARLAIQANRGDRVQAMHRALADLDEAVKQSPQLVEAHIERAKVAESLGRLVEAVGSLSRALAVVRFDAAVLRDRARLLMAMGRPREAVQDCLTLIRAGQATQGDWRRSGDCHAALGLWRDAIHDYTELVRHAPDDDTARLARARCYAEQHDWPAALADCDRVILAWPLNPAALCLRTTIAQRQSASSVE